MCASSSLCGKNEDFSNFPLFNTQEIYLWKLFFEKSVTSQSVVNAQQIFNEPNCWFECLTLGRSERLSNLYPATSEQAEAGITVLHTAGLEEAPALFAHILTYMKGI